MSKLKRNIAKPATWTPSPQAIKYADDRVREAKHDLIQILEDRIFGTILPNLKATISDELACAKENI